ncbi:MAG: S4 domain-containing protein, partial [Chitinophagaceae bacterium]
TVFVHGRGEYNKAKETTNRLFTGQSAPAESLSVEEIERLEGIVRIEFPEPVLQQGIDVVAFLAETAIFTSKGEARKMIQNGGVRINGHK